MRYLCIKPLVTYSHLCMNALHVYPSAIITISAGRCSAVRTHAILIIFQQILIADLYCIHNPGGASYLHYWPSAKKKSFPHYKSRQARKEKRRAHYGQSLRCGTMTVNGAPGYFLKILSKY